MFVLNFPLVIFFANYNKLTLFIFTNMIFIPNKSTIGIINFLFSLILLFLIFFVLLYVALVCRLAYQYDKFQKYCFKLQHKTQHNNLVNKKQNKE